MNNSTQRASWRRILGIFCLAAFAFVTTFASSVPEKITGGITTVEDEFDCMIPSPNPSTTGNITLTAEGTEDVIQTIVIKNANNVVVFEKTVNAHSYNLDTSGLSAGNYFLIGTTDNCSSYNRMIVSQ